MTGVSPKLPTPPGVRNVQLFSLLSVLFAAIGIPLSSGTVQIIAAVAPVIALPLGQLLVALLHKHWAQAAVDARTAAADLLSLQLQQAQLPPGTVFPPVPGRPSTTPSPAVEKTP